MASVTFDAVRVKTTLPDVLLAPAITRRVPRLVSTGGAVSLERSFSGSSYYMTLAGMRAGQIDGAFTLFTGAGNRALQARGLAWKAGQRLSGRRTGGFKFTGAFNDTLWRRYLPAVAGSYLLHNIQTVGRYFIDNRRRYGVGSAFYVDGSLAEYLETYGDFDLATVDPAVLVGAIAVERDAYRDADLIFTMSRKTADTLGARYGLDPARVIVVQPGANFSDEAIRMDGASAAPATDEFVLGFVGLYPERKGLPRLIRAVRLLRARGVKVRVRVIGRLPDGESGGDGVEYLGEISKRTDMRGFLEALAPVDLGCQLSHAEFAGIALCEFLRLGIPVCGTMVGGAIDILEQGGSIRLAPEVTPAELADILSGLIADRARYAALRAEAESLRHWASWTRAIEEIGPLLDIVSGMEHRQEQEAAC